MTHIKIPKFDQARVLVIGDIMLDRYWHGDVARISPEAPVPVVKINNIEERVGGAGNVALNTAALGCKTSILSLVGNDENAKTLANLLEQANVEHYLIPVSNIPTISKLRIIGRNQQLIRLDQEESFADINQDNFIRQYCQLLPDIDVVIFSDYNKGTLSSILQLIKLANAQNKITLVDPKNKDFSIYNGATIIKPNLSEFEAAAGHCHTDAQIENKALELLKTFDFQAILITRGSNGLSLITKDGTVNHMPTKACEVYDVTGAGDSVIAVLGASLAAGEDLLTATILANIAAGISVKKLGATAVSIFELRRAICHKQNNLRAKVVNEEDLLQQVSDAKAHNETIVMTNGCFDILHPGHVIYLEQAKALGHRLIIAVNSDSSVKRLKGESRPINSLLERMVVLAALDSVDWVVVFDEDTPERLIKVIKPDILLKGGDWQIDQIAGGDFVLANGGQVVTIPFEDGFSTSNILKKIALG